LTADNIVVRRVETQAEYDECVRIQDETWGASFNERVPSTILKVTQYLGGVTAAAFDGPGEGRPMLGFVFGMTGLRDGHLVHWSDMLAVRAKARDHGIGRRLKLYQRSLVAEMGVTRIVWTFDPLVSRNAHLNLNSLGARVTDYVPDMYGLDTGSALHSIGTDRFVVSWELFSEVGGEAGKRGGGEVSRAAGRRGSEAETLVEIPLDIQELIARTPERAREWRESTRQAFLRHLADGYHVSGFERVDGKGYYRLTREAD
jgi:predicted GNAT superfamily acetyltransferase